MPFSLQGNKQTQTIIAIRAPATFLVGKANPIICPHSQSVALELLLRTLWTERSLQASDPEKFIFEAIEGMCASMSETSHPHGSVEEFVYDQAEARLRDFLQNVDTRIRAHLRLRRE